MQKEAMMGDGMGIMIGFDAPQQPRREPCAWRIRAGGPPAAFPLGKEGLRVPGLLHGPDSLPIELFADDGKDERPERTAVTVSLVHRHALRVAPWGTFWLAPDFSFRNGYQGYAYYDQEIALIWASVWRPYNIMGTVLHEAWHLLENKMEQYFPDLLSPLERLNVFGTDYRDNDYMCLPRERRARAFESMGLYAMETGRLPEGRDIPPEMALLARAWSGELGAMVMDRMQASRAA